MANGKATKEIGRCWMWGPSSMGIINLQNPKWKWWAHIRKYSKKEINCVDNFWFPESGHLHWETLLFQKMKISHMAPHGYAFHVIPFFLCHTKNTCVSSILQSSNIYFNTFGWDIRFKILCDNILPINYCIKINLKYTSFYFHHRLIFNLKFNYI